MHSFTVYLRCSMGYCFAFEGFLGKRYTSLSEFGSLRGSKGPLVFTDTDSVDDKSNETNVLGGLQVFSNTLLVGMVDYEAR